MLAKFVGADGRPHRYPNTWTREKMPHGERLVIAPASSHVDVMLDLAAILEAPLGILWVLTVPRAHDPPEEHLGRYQSPVTLTFDQTAEFVRGYQAFLEGDGRHHFWIMSAFGEGQVIYDNHNVLYFYGDVDRATRVLSARGLKAGGRPRFPVPHSHSYNREFDADEVRMMNHWEWVRLPIVDEFDDP